MTDLTNPAEIDGAIDNRASAHSWGKNALVPWIVDGTDISHLFTEIDPTGVDAFDTLMVDGLDLHIAGGEAYLYGWLVRDTETIVSVPDDSTEAIYLGYDMDIVLGSTESPADSENIIIGTESDFADEDPRTILYEVESEAGSIVNVDDLRVLGRPGGLNTSGNYQVAIDSRFSANVTFDEPINAVNGIVSSGSLVLESETQTVMDVDGTSVIQFGSGNVLITPIQSVTIDADVTIDGDLTVTGTIDN